jgi:protein SCO1/2
MKNPILALAVTLALPAMMALPAAAQETSEHCHPQAAAQPAAAKTPETPQVAEAQPLDGLNVPDVPLVDQDGKPVRFYTDLVKDRVVAVNFVFTSCTTVCPPMGANFAKLRKILSARAGREVQLISVSVDPGTDTPERLKAWGAKFGAGPGWTLVTGDRNQVTLLLKSLGVYTANISDHSPLVLLGDDTRHRWTRAYGLAAPAKLAELIDQIAGPATPETTAKKESR